MGNFRRIALAVFSAALTATVACASNQTVRPEQPPTGPITPLVSQAQTPTHLLGKGMAEVQVLLDRSKGLSSAAISILSASGGWSVPEHRHPEADEVLYILEGGGELTLEGEKIQVAAGHAVFIPRNALHAFVCGAQGVKALQVYAPGGPEQRFLKAPVKPDE